jgi:PPOX class probable F420-dependent enzyme
MRHTLRGDGGDTEDLSRDQRRTEPQEADVSIIDEIPESHRDLLTSPLTAALTTLDAKGRPQSTAVWFIVDDDGSLKGSITDDRQKYKNLNRNSDCTLLIIDPSNPWRTLEIRAEAELTADPQKATVSKFAEVYGVDEAMLKASGDNRFTVTYRPRRVVTNPPPQP